MAMMLGLISEHTSQGSYTHAYITGIYNHACTYTHMHEQSVNHISIKNLPEKMQA